MIEPLNELADLVAELFSPIANRGRDPLPMIHDNPSTSEGVRLVCQYELKHHSWPVTAVRVSTDNHGISYGRNNIPSRLATTIVAPQAGPIYLAFSWP